MHFALGSLQNESESIFNYTLTNGSFDKYKNDHTRPIFLEDYLGNLTALFSNYSEENVTTFNQTCWNDWENKQDNACLLAIARTSNITHGERVHNNTYMEHLRYEKQRKL